jgi:hypothetical protein
VNFTGQLNRSALGFRTRYLAQSGHSGFMSTRPRLKQGSMRAFVGRMNADAVASM